MAAGAGRVEAHDNATAPGHSGEQMPVETIARRVRVVTLGRMAQARRNLTLVRLRAGRGLTQAQLAELLTGAVQAAGPRWRNTTLTAQYISRLEIGRITWPNTVYRAALRAVLGVPTDADLGLYCQQVATAGERTHAMHRRDFLATLPTVALAEHPLGDLIAAATAEPTPPPHRVGLEHAHQIRQLARQADVLDHLHGGGLTREILGAQVRWAIGLLDAHVDRAAEPELLSATGDLCIAAGFACHDGGQAGAARYYLAAALRCAVEADDWELRARALSNMAAVAAYCGDGEDALTLAQQAQIRADRFTPLRRSRLALLEAHAHGRRGDSSACLAAIGRAEDEFAAADPANEPPVLTFFFSPAELAGDSANALHHLALHGSHVDTALNRHREAVAGYSAAHPRSRTLSTTKLATLLLHSGDPAEAVHLGHQALDTAEQLRSRRITDSIRDLHHATTQHNSPEVHDLRQRAARALAG